MKEKISEANERWDAVRTALLRCQTASEVRNYFKFEKNIRIVLCGINVFFLLFYNVYFVHVAFSLTLCVTLSQTVDDVHADETPVMVIELVTTTLRITTILPVTMITPVTPVTPALINHSPSLPHSFPYLHSPLPSTLHPPLPPP